MLTINKILPAGRGLAPVLLKRAATLDLDWDVRQKSRFDAVDSQGRELGVFLARGVLVRGGDVLVAEDGSLIKVTAAPQPVMVVRSDPKHGSPFDLVRAAYHLGNRHVPLELQHDHLKLEPDHVLAEMLRMNRLVVTEASDAFEPEGGAYTAESMAGGHGHAGHDHGHDHSHEGHDHDQGHAHDDHDHGHTHAHGDHDPDHGHDAKPATGAASRLDRFGRDPSDPHYGHNHR